MDRNRMKRLTALLLVISMLLTGSGEQHLTMAASVSGEETVTSQETSKKQEDTQTEEEQEPEETPEKNNNQVDTVEEDMKKNAQNDENDGTSEKADGTTLSKSKAAASVVSTALLGEGTNNSNETGESIPVKDAEGNLPELTQGTLYLISDNAGWKALAEYSKLDQYNGLEGYRFKYNQRIQENGTVNTYDLTNFEGIGDEAHPFKGELSSNYAVGNITLKLKRPLFNYLSSKAIVNNNYIEMVNGSCAGLTGNLIVEEDANVRYEDIHVSGSIGSDSTSSCVGGLIGQVKVTSGKTFTLSGSNIEVTASVNGVSSTTNTLPDQTVGGVIGKVTGSMSLDLTGFKISNTSSTKHADGVVGGIIGIIGSAGKGKGNFTLSSTASEGIVYTPQGNGTNSEGICVGGFFGKILNTNFILNAPLKYINNSQTLPVNLKGIDVGVFSGYIENSSVTLNAPMVFQDVRINRNPYTSTENSSWENHGVGMFAGVLINSELSVGNDFKSDSNNENTPAITIANPNVNSRANVYDFYQEDANFKYPFNYGGLVGYADNSDLNFTEKHKCQINGITTGKTRGNVSAVVGRYVVSDKERKMQYIDVGTTTSSAYARLIGWEGNTGGLTGLVHLSGSGGLTIENCSFNGTIGFAIDDKEAAFSTGVAKVTSDQNATGRIALKNVSCKSTFSKQANGKWNTYGGVIGSIDANFDICNVTSVNQSDSNPINDFYISYFYYGGLVGVVYNPNESLRTGKISGNTTVGKCLFRKDTKAYGGLIGKTEKKTAISIDGSLDAANQTMYSQTGYVGSVVGEIDNSLIYFEPGYSFTKSKYYQCDEIGNYGGVIRNRNWDNNEGNGTKLIKDYKVTGELSTSINTMGDLLRFAIAMNTEGVFLPEKNGSSDTATLKSFTEIQKASYTLTQDSYDLTVTGVVCLARNDDEGIKNSSFYGSFTGNGSTNGKSTILYNITTCGQKYIGLFPKICARDSNTSVFQNLNLDGTISYQSILTTKINNENFRRPAQSQNAGGLAAIAEGSINIENVTFSGSITDISNCEWKTYNEKTGWFDKNNNEKNTIDYMGGIFGQYKGTDGSILTMNGLSCTTNLTYQDYTHLMGGVIGYVDVTDVTDTDKPCQIQITGTETNPVTLAGQMKVSKLNDTNVGSNNFPIKIGGMIAQIGDSPSANYSPKCKLTIQNVNVSDLNLNESVSTSSDEEIGGLLGWHWSDVDVTLENTKIDSSRLSVNAPFGGLVHTVCGKILVEGLTFGADDTNKMTIDAQNSGVDQCGLLVRDGQKLYLDVRAYSGYDSVDLSNYSCSYFDDLVGFTKNQDDSRHGGIISIGNNDANKYYLGGGNSEQVYSSFNGQHVSNPNTRYYYDLNKIAWKDGNGTSYDISMLNSPDAVMRWHLLHYADPYLRSALIPDATSPDALPQKYTISGSEDIDMTGYSIYPTPAEDETYTAESDVRIIFNAEAIITGEKTISRYPDTGTCQHYQMHAGLFGDISGVTVDGLKITGSYSRQNPVSGNATAGALVAGSIYGRIKDTDSQGNIVYNEKIENKFSNILLDNLWCVSSETSLTYDAPIGLMIADISSGAQVSFDHISMTGYTDDNIQGKNKAASALIGNVGNGNATDISMKFINMDIADGANEQHDEKSSAKDQVLAKASFIYSYNYKSNCSGIYTFTYEDYLYGRCTASAVHNNFVTLGQELGDKGGDPNYANEEYYDRDMPVGQLMGEDTSSEMAYDCDNYLPYVCTTDKKILVNPKAGHITVGCGTYEDPYVISTAKQLITLYRYLYEEDQYSEILINGKWQLNPVGNDNHLCDKTTDSANGHGAAVTYGGKNTEGFPGKNLLSLAYYQITADIDLSTYSDFEGFGRDNLPFNGVFVGKQIPEQNSAYPTITMPIVPSDSDMSNYGWIQYAKGCVVKDLSIVYPSPVSIHKQETKTNEQGVTESVDADCIGGGVIATVLGGENIIDNVAVKKGKSAGACFYTANQKAMIGGYVGVVNAGGVLLRNIGEHSFSGFSVSVKNPELDETSESDATILNQYPKVCGIVGKVFNGYVVYDGAENSSAALFRDLGKYLNPNNMVQSRSYDIINGAYLKAVKDETITYSYAEGDSAPKYNIANAAQLQAFSMALNAGLLNYGQSKALYVGYDSASRQRSGDYRYVGNVSDSDEASNKARTAVCMYDNENGYQEDNTSKVEYHSYLSQFFNWADMKGNKSNLHPSQKVKRYNLSGTTYDMSVFGTAFRGLGARYFGAQDTRGDVFLGNLTGPESGVATITLDMKVDTMDQLAVQDVEDAALLNNVIGNGSQTIDIKNITLTGTVRNQSSDDVIATNGVGTKNAAALISTLKKVSVNFENVNLDTMQVSSQRYAGGFVATNPESTSNILTFNDCNIIKENGKNDKTQIVGFADAGGFIGCATSIVYVNNKEGNDASLSKLEYLDVENTSKPAEGGTFLADTVKKNTGGVIGTATAAKFTINNIQGSHVTVKTTGDKQNVQIGGIVGRAADKGYVLKNITLTNLIVQNEFDNNTSERTYASGCSEGTTIIATAGIIGAVKGSLTLDTITVGSENKGDSVCIKNDGNKVPTHNAFCTAGIVGRHYSGGTITATNCNVLGAKKSDNTNTTVIYGRGSSVAGMFGNCNTLKSGTKELKVQNVELDAARYCGGITAWLEGGYSFNIDKAQVKGISLSLSPGNSSDYGDVGGLIGRCANGCTINLTDVGVEDITNKSSYCKNSGGLFGNNNANQLTISGTQNKITNCFLTGTSVGGIAGKIDHLTSNSNISLCKSITISGNKIISSRENYSTNGFAGGFAGDIQIGNGLCVDGLTIENNLISGYYSNASHYGTLGGVAGKMNSDSCFYHVNLTNNYIGMMKFPSTVENSVSGRMTYLKTNQIDTLKENLYFMTISGLSSVKVSTSISDFYNYCYWQGTVLGNATNANGISKFIKVHVSYSNPAYRPVTDVGMSSSVSVSDNTSMYRKCRELCAIVYDGRITDDQTPTISEKFSGISIDGLDANTPYVFGNVDSIMKNYADTLTKEEGSPDKRNAYRLGDNYQKKTVIDSDNKNYSLQSVYNNTYKDEQGNYKSPYKVGNNPLPMVVYRSSENGSLDQVIQSYINILTNNSGGLNSYVNQQKTSSDLATVLSVDCYPMLISNGNISVNTETNAKASVSVTANPSDGTGKGNTTYEFSSENGDEITDASSGTFTLIRIQYGWKDSGQSIVGPTVHWTLYIPVYAEKRLKVTSNMTLLEGTKYNIDTLVKSGKHVETGVSSPLDMVLTKGSGYSIYSEFIYGNSEKFNSVKMSKKLFIKTNAEIYFTPGTQLTLIPLDEGRKPYYYTVPETESGTKPKQIMFTAFQDTSGSSYVTKDIVSKSENDNTKDAYELKANYTDICNQNYEKVRVERFVILVNRPKDNLANQSYELHVAREDDITSTDKEWALFSRTEYTDHCYASINEIKGASYTINNNTKLTASRIAEDGRVAVELHYDVSADPTYWTSVGTSKAEFADIGFSLGYKSSEAGSSLVKIPFPSATVATYGTGENKVIVPLQGKPSTVYYYQGSGSFMQVSGTGGKNVNFGEQIDISFDFSAADLSELENYKDGSFYVIAELVTTENKDLPANGTLRAEWNSALDAEMKSDFGFALNVDDLETLGMNQYLPEDSDSGVVPYTASIAFPEKSSEDLSGKYYTIIYQIEEKKLQQNETGKTAYEAYTGDDVSLFLGNFDNNAEAKTAAGSNTNSVNSGNGFVAVTYKFTHDQITKGADLTYKDNGITENSNTETAYVIKTHCTLVANCAGLNMTNYRVKAYLLVSDQLPTVTISDNGVLSYSDSSTGNTPNSDILQSSCLRQEGKWSTVSAEQLKDLKSDYFVFTVAKIKTTM
ncbi:MAG: hypothetical protein MR508_06480 [Lachnospiraceae bacterium]|nr:hypothetical protein [Lachnospiraceae bacterium]